MELVDGSGMTADGIPFDTETGTCTVTDPAFANVKVTGIEFAG
jgi:hypothetical protein